VGEFVVGGVGTEPGGELEPEKRRQVHTSYAG